MSNENLQHLDYWLKDKNFVGIYEHAPVCGSSNNKITLIAALPVGPDFADMMEDVYRVLTSGMESVRWSEGAFVLRFRKNCSFPGEIDRDPEADLKGPFVGLWINKRGKPDGKIWIDENSRFKTTPGRFHTFTIQKPE